MSTLMQLKNVSLTLGHPPLLDGIELLIKANERICLVGRNGCGKSTLLKVIAGDMAIDDGQRILGSDVIISRLPQDPPTSVEMSLFDYVAEELKDIGKLLQDYAHQIVIIAEDASEKQLNKLQDLQQQLDHNNGWQFEQRIHQVLTQLQLEPEQQLSSLSGGWRRKAALARALVANPDILLLDEPTNHLDIDMIGWLEKVIVDYQGAVVFVSHDRAFIRSIATRIVDLDRGQLTSYPGNYQEYLDKKQQDLEIEQTHNALFDKKLSQEETWIRQGIKARRTRNEGRVRALKALRNEYSERRKVTGKARIDVKESQSSGKIVFEAENLGYKFTDKPIINSLDLLIQRGDKIALIGPNGCGKSTLIKLLLQELEPQQGSIRQGTKIDLAYFDQHRQQLDPTKTLIDCIADGKREITLNGRTKHVISYLQDFLFTPERANVPVSALSGGEKNRLLLAKLMTKPNNLLILDEPTNDLDVETLELLEDTISEYPGTVILVSHDREFVDNVVTSSLFFAGNGEVIEFIGGYSEIRQWYQQQKQITQAHETSVKSRSPTPKPVENKAKKLSYKLQLELDKLPSELEKMEKQLDDLQDQVNHPDFFKQDASQSRQKLDKLAEVEQNLATAFARWEELESMK